MPVSWWRVRAKLKTHGVALVLAMLGALLALLISVFIHSFSMFNNKEYQPKDMERGRMLEEGRP